MPWPSNRGIWATFAVLLAVLAFFAYDSVDLTTTSVAQNNKSPSLQIDYLTKSTLHPSATLPFPWPLQC
jgi:hypothetical protein